MGTLCLFSERENIYESNCSWDCFCRSGLAGHGSRERANSDSDLRRWHCYSDACSWASVPNMTTFDTENHWMIDRNLDGTYHPR